jgi:pimeloyl-ACP methyl ester carboxylesterase
VGHVDAIDAIGLDLAGFGAAPAPLEPWGLADYAGAVAPILSEMGDKVVILGHSFGGRVALRVAAANAERVTALVLSGVPFVLGPQGRVKPKVCYRATRLLWRAGLMSDVRMESARQRYGSRDYRNATGVMRAVLVRVLGESDGAVLSALNMPVELIWGADDTAASPDRARAAAALLSSATLEVLPGIDHFTPIHAPGALRAGILTHRP